MRKLTGYIGALVIVFTLVGTIGLGYALNVTNEDVTRDKYDLVTDISGLYSHSQEKTYIDYNPASNYTGFAINNNVYENTGLPMKRMGVGESVTFTISGVSFEGKNYSLPNYNTYVFGCTYGYLYSIPGNPGIYWTNASGDYGVSTITYTWNGAEILISSNVSTYSVNTGIAPYVYYPYDDYDGVATQRSDIYHYSNNTSWVNGKSFLIYGWANPAYNGNGFFVYGSDGWNTVRMFPNGNEIPFPTNEFYWASNQKINNDVDKGWPTIHYTYSGSTLDLWFVIGPRYVYTDTMGINYTESARVNNYLVSDINGTTGGAVNLTSGMSNQARPADYIRLDSMYNGSEFNRQTDYAGDPPRPIRIQYDRYNYAYKDPYCTNLTTVLNNIPVEMGASSIEISNKTNTPITTPTFNPEGWPAEYVDYGARMDYNAVWFYVGETPLYSGSQSIYNGSLTDNAWTNTLGSSEKIIYDITRGTADLYVNDVKIGTYSPNDIKIMYGGTQVRQTIHYDSARPVTQMDTITATDNYSFAPTPITTLTWKQYYEQVHYMDPTKGVSIQNDTITTWSNGYENCDIQILFRMENLNGVYQNTIKVGSDTLTISSHDGNFYVEINNDGAVNIGNWRNIVLDIDCLNGEVKVYPVRTFNNYTNVVLYGGTDVFVGNLTDRDTINSIDFGASNNSFTFLIYNTKVFMDTYGVVMIDPTLNVNDYFTNLNDFYKISIKNFTLTGGSITINDYTYDVNDGKIEIDNSTQKLANMEIVYKSGKTNVLFKDTDTNVDLGDTVSYVLSFSGSWYFESYLYAGSEYIDKEYVWHFEEFVIDNSQFVVIYLGLMAVSFVVARKFCTFTITDYIVMIASIIIIMGVQVIA